MKYACLNARPRAGAMWNRCDMSSRPEITRYLSELLEKYIDPHNDPRIYWAKEVTFDYGTENAVRVDYMRYQPANNSVSGIEKGDFYCYEVKSSVDDFLSKNGHNMIGDLNYYVMPEAVFTKVKDKIQYYVGVLCPDNACLKIVKKAHRQDRSRHVSEMLLMMWRSSRREVVKQRKQKAELEV